MPMLWGFSDLVNRDRSLLHLGGTPSRTMVRVSVNPSRSEAAAPG